MEINIYDGINTTVYFSERTKLRIAITNIDGPFIRAAYIFGKYSYILEKSFIIFFISLHFLTIKNTSFFKNGTQKFIIMV